MNRTLGDMGRFSDMQLTFLLSICHLGDPGHDHPLLASMMMQLEAQRRPRTDAYTLHLKTNIFTQYRVRAPRSLYSGRHMGYSFSAILELLNNRFHLLSPIRRTDQERVFRVNNYHIF